MVDIYFPQISNATDRKYLVMADLAFSGMFLGDVNSNRSLGKTAEFCPCSFFLFPLLDLDSIFPFGSYSPVLECNYSVFLE